MHAVAVAGPLPDRLLAPAGFRIGVGPEVTATEAPRSWEGALRALRFAGTSRSDVGLAPVAEEPAIYHSSLGAFEVLARELSGPAIAGIGDLDVLDALAAEPGSGTELLATLEVLVQAGSLRAAARELHLHHNSVAVRVTRAEAALGYGLGETAGRFRLALALALRPAAGQPGVAPTARAAPQRGRKGRQERQRETGEAVDRPWLCPLPLSGASRQPARTGADRAPPGS